MGVSISVKQSGMQGEYTASVYCQTHDPKSGFRNTPTNAVTLTTKHLTCLGARPNVRDCQVSDRSTQTSDYVSAEHGRQEDRQWLQESKCVRDNRSGTTSDTLGVPQEDVSRICALSRRIKIARCKITHAPSST